MQKEDLHFEYNKIELYQNRKSIIIISYGKIIFDHGTTNVLLFIFLQGESLKQSEKKKEV